ncbi:Subversion of eukaryotic traffic protein A [Xenorhabdus kozodoii]|uniref:Subversion of eukaryotic traffic protein A n=1 Tax=Xenorhabdus kozodoii TaxID=351676 RepID=A0A2D0LEJ1_9GAMM|nr:Subversion of eukaryotic traffic protein A [Xenorhabdus kozodoii]
MNIPRKIHYFWTGNEISERNLRNIITVKSENPSFEVNLWVNNKVLISNTLSETKSRVKNNAKGGNVYPLALINLLRMRDKTYRCIDFIQSCLRTSLGFGCTLCHDLVQ